MRDQGEDQRLLQRKIMKNEIYEIMDGKGIIVDKVWASSEDDALTRYNKKTGRLKSLFKAFKIESYVFSTG